MSKPSQDNTTAVLTTPLGKDVLLFHRFDGEEGLGSLFEWRIEALSTEPNLDFNPALGRNACVTLKRYEDIERHFNGVLTHAAWSGRYQNAADDQQDLYIYSLVLRPWLWCLSQSADCRIFKQKSIPEILKTVFEERGFTDLRLSLTDNYPPLEYCVQYRESDLTYALRLMEEHGIYYYFEHSRDKHVLVLCDSPSSHQSIPNLPSVRYHPRGQDHMRTAEYVEHWRNIRNFRTGKVRLKDYDFKVPNKDLKAETQSSSSYAHSDLMAYDYHTGRYEERSDGERFARIRLQAAQAQDERREAAGDASSLYPGGLTTLKEHDTASENQNYLVLRSHHTFRNQSYFSVAETDSTPPYMGAYTFLMAKKPFRMPLVTPKPLVHGSQTAKVVTKEGEEIDVDEHGRIEVLFHWDLDKKYSRRVRVAQAWSSKTWGGQFIPRKDQEVIITCLEGDPDQPMVTGTVYNGNNHSPYELPAQKTRMVIRSQTHKGQGFNELTFEDENNQQNLFLHAQKDKTIRVLHNDIERIDKHQVSSVGGNQSLEVAKSQKTEIGGSMNITIGGTGAMAIAVAAQGAGLAGTTASLLQEAGSIGGGGGELGSFAMTVASIALGYLSGGGLSSRGGVVAGSNPRADAGDALRKSGSGVGDSVGGVFPMSGIMNTVVGTFQSDTVGIGRTEQIGIAKVTNVGGAQMVNVGLEQHTKIGKKRTVTVGEEQHTKVGQKITETVGKLYHITSQENFKGDAKVWEIFADDKILLSAPGGYIEINKQGIKIRGLKIDIEGNQINFSRGGPGEGSKCLREMAKSSTPFVK